MPLFTAAVDLPATEYDFVIVGGGTGGNVIASRLSENPDWNVLVIESGPSNEGILNAEVPCFYYFLQKTEYDWNNTTTPQKDLNGRSVGIPRGHLLGGSSSFNGMLYTRGSSADFDRFAKVTNDDGWSWENLQPYIRKTERWVPPTDNRDITGQFTPSAHNLEGTGKVAVGLAGHPQGIDSHIIQATKELPEEFPYNEDHASGNLLGVGYMQYTIEGGKRSSSATAYLSPDVRARPNLHILVGTRVTRVIPSHVKGTNASEDLEFKTVELAKDATSPRTTVTASKEVILSAGTVGTPHILLHSGIGPATELSAVGIEPTFNLPEVGKNLVDHPSVGNSWLVNSTDTLEKFKDMSLVGEALKQWQESKQGPFVVNGISHVGWGRLPSDSPVLKEYEDPSAGSNAPHFEMLIVNGGVRPGLPQGNFNYFGIVTQVAAPKSRGSISLTSSDPFAPPSIDPGYFSSQYDLLAMREAIKAVQRFVAAPTFKDYIIAPAGGLESVTSDEDYEQYIRNHAHSADHLVGTCAMSAKGSKTGVLGPDMKVKGVQGLRVVDASVMPFIPSAHTMFPVYVIAERASDMIKESWKNA